MVVVVISWKLNLLINSAVFFHSCYLFVSGLKLHVAQIFTHLALFPFLVTGTLLAYQASEHKRPGTYLENVIYFEVFVAGKWN